MYGCRILKCFKTIINFYFYIAFILTKCHILLLYYNIQKKKKEKVNNNNLNLEVSRFKVSFFPSKTDIA